VHSCLYCLRHFAVGDHAGEKGEDYGWHHLGSTRHDSKDLDGLRYDGGTLCSSGPLPPPHRTHTPAAYYITTLEAAVRHIDRMELPPGCEVDEGLDSDGEYPEAPPPPETASTASPSRGKSNVLMLCRLCIKCWRTMLVLLPAPASFAPASRCSHSFRASSPR
jgi:hypothetical protein